MSRFISVFLPHLPLERLKQERVASGAAPLADDRPLALVGNEEHGLVLTAVNAASVGKAGAIRVIPGDPAGSYLIQKLEGASGIVGERMPQDGPPFLTVGQIAIIRQWIQDGAPNN